MASENLLVELFVEELPPKALKKLGLAFATVLADSLKAQGLAAADAVVSDYASPRRLAVHVTGVAAQAADKAVSQKLMPVAVGLDASGQATPALLKKLQALGAGPEAVAGLQKRLDGKAEALYFDSTVRGATLADGLQKALLDTIAKLPIPKLMSYQLERDCDLPGWSTVSFVRPAHGLLALHGSAVVPVHALGLQAGNSTQGHRFEALMSPVLITHADDYAATLARDGVVIASFDERSHLMVQALRSEAKRLGRRLEVEPPHLSDDQAEAALLDNALVQEVTGLVERPTVMVCNFDKEFLDVPQECLILTMKANQKYFPLFDDAGKLSNQFLIVSNINPADPSFVIGGNERVVRPRLADAKFFFEQDKKHSLESRVQGLSKVVYYNQLGTQGDRMLRVCAIAQTISRALHLDDSMSAQVQTAARLAKADLLTDMVGEFPELQGTMGAYYARHDGLGESVATAIEDHYKPRFAGDELPRSQLAMVVALADKLETLIGMFGVGNLPTGDKDPFALRRHALGVIRMLMESAEPLALEALLHESTAAYAALHAGLQDANAALVNFIFDRLSSALREQGASAQQVDAVLALRPQLLAEVPKQLAAVRAFASLPESAALAAANKRIGNILKKSEAAQGQVDAALLQEEAEKALFAAMQTVVPQADAWFAAKDYTASLQALAALRAPVDAFFDGVMVNADDPALKANRLALLQQLHSAMNRVADLAKLAA
ncbi:MAG: glycine--tRNA ligase subunit beta [Rhodoferax sp.]|nr:glycine--tRNA ligase subunit beta [Rhodoferax sp.]MBJ7469155.1 glycine--tRNA ligase subunit beta [Rhodoferax sp.]